jgi:uncharacterized membrane protein
LLVEPTTPTRPPSLWEAGAGATGRSATDRTATILLVATTIATGLLAGLFYGYACSVMPGLARAGDRTLVDGMQQINEAILNPIFFVTFMGAPALNLAAWLVLRRSRHHDGRDDEVLRWILIGLALSVLGFVVTMALNVPLNDDLAAAGDPARIADMAAVRHDFLGPWVVWNIVRTLAITGSFVALVWALVVGGRRRTTLEP